MFASSPLRFALLRAPSCSVPCLRTRLECSRLATPSLHRCGCSSSENTATVPTTAPCPGLASCGVGVDQHPGFIACALQLHTHVSTVCANGRCACVPVRACSCRCGGMRGVCLNTQLYKNDASAKEEKKAQDKWLDKVLDAPVPKHSVAFGHIPPFIVAPDEPAGYFNFTPEIRGALLGKLKKAGACTAPTQLQHCVVIFSAPRRRLLFARPVRPTSADE